MLTLGLIKNTISLVAPPVSTTATMSDEGNNDDLATTTAISYVVTSIAVNGYANQQELKAVQDTMVYIESMSEEELAEAERLISEKELDFEMPNSTSENDIKQYVYVRSKDIN